MLGCVAQDNWNDFEAKLVHKVDKVVKNLAECFPTDAMVPPSTETLNDLAKTHMDQVSEVLTPVKARLVKDEGEEDRPCF